ncbi:MAG TPA: Trk family potassium uptake protein [Candidatus Protoclostridium stercorigallinarum]|uniref:Trk family potassium uptake protein n=1 Tax=Candidatus Protoclostridium stercorigallinarum TaxID=2838741 RepID=A0A9D1PZ72_9FIRM|nr:Trk family potassium uptake protein [Candidatus Protoclostridium stercorigallinarum]
MTPARLLVLGFLAIIAVGTILLILPISSKTREVTPFIDAMFTTVSASCVTGLISVDTNAHWSLFGQIVILILIQTGGVGFMTFVFAFLRLSGKKISLKSRTVMQEAVAAPELGGMGRLTGTILGGTFICEAIGAGVLCFAFVPELGAEGVWVAVFTAVSAFCNAGFDLMGGRGNGEFISLTEFSGNPVVCLTVPLLIIIGGLGFFVWHDIRKNRHHVSRYGLHTKIVLVTTAAFIIIPTLIIMCAETDLTITERIFSSFFTAVSPRTAGFNVLDLNNVRLVTVFLTIILMCIGGASGSTAGGIKVNTFAVLVLSLFSIARRKNSVEAFGKRIDEENIKTATQFVTMYLSVAIVGVIMICLFEMGNPYEMSLTDIVFEVASGIGTVGLTLGITPHLGAGSLVVLAMLMYLGRVGCLTFMLCFRAPSDPVAILPQESVRIG